MPGRLRPVVRKNKNESINSKNINGDESESDNNLSV